MNFITPLLAEVSAKPDMGFAGMVTFTGIVVVFLVLTALVLIFSIFGKVMSAGGKKKKEKAPAKAAPAPKAAPAAAPSPAPAVAGVAPEIVAVIAAALAASGESGKIRSVRPAIKRAAGRNPWAAAGIMENTRQF